MSTWSPSSAVMDNANLTDFLRVVGIADWKTLLRRSNEEPAWYWDAVIRYYGIRFLQPYQMVMDVSEGPEWTRWCVGGTTNITLNCLDKHKGTRREQEVSIIWEGEDGSRRSWTYGELIQQTSRLAAGLKELGIGPGEAVGIFMPMMPETVAAFFAVAKIGAIAVPLFSGFGSDAVAARLRDADAVAVLATDTTKRRGRTVPIKETLDKALEACPSVQSVIVLESGKSGSKRHATRDVGWEEIVKGQPKYVPCEAMDADSPFMVIFTSGTTGKAKGTVHTHCGFVTKLASDFGLTLDFKSSDRMLWMSDLGWLVGPMQLVVTSFFGGGLVLGEGTPDYPESGRLWRLVQDHNVTYLGLTPTAARLMMSYGADEASRHDLSSLRIVVSSGELWTPDSWDWIFEHICQKARPILNVSGGTEVGWGIITSNVLQSAKPCSFAGPCLASGADVVDEWGNTVAVGERGELVMRVPSIGLTRGLWCDPDRYLDTYWRKIPGLWVHGDWATVDEDGFWYLHGRSDDTIMVAGKRCGPSEIEDLLMASGHLAEAAACAINDPVKGEAVLCVCVPTTGESVDETLKGELRDAVVKSLGSAFRPKDIVFVSDLPKTRSGKVMRRIVRAAYEGGDPGDLASLANPEAVQTLKVSVQKNKSAAP